MSEKRYDLDDVLAENGITPIEMHPDFCMAHGRLEPSPPGTFRVCVECGHVFPTAEDLVADVRALEQEFRKADRERGLPPEFPWEIDPQKWPTCPHCSHDF